LKETPAEKQEKLQKIQEKLEKKQQKEGIVVKPPVLSAPIQKGSSLFQSVHVRLQTVTPEMIKEAESKISNQQKSRGQMIEVILNDRLGKKVRVKCNPDDKVGDLKKLAAAQLGTRSDKLRIQKWYTIYKDHITLQDYEIHDGMGLELYYM